MLVAPEHRRVRPWQPACFPTTALAMQNALPDPPHLTLFAPTPQTQLHGHVHAYERTYPMAYYQRVQDGPMVSADCCRQWAAQS